MKHYKIIAWDQNTNSDPKINLNVTFPFQKGFLFKKFSFIGLWETSHAGKQCIQAPCPIST
jgi:hypothetical protein